MLELMIQMIRLLDVLLKNAVDWLYILRETFHLCIVDTGRTFGCG